MITMQPYRTGGYPAGPLKIRQMPKPPFAQTTRTEAPQAGKITLSRD